MFKDNTISKRVMAVIKAKIADHQKVYSSQLEAMEERHEAEHEALLAGHETQKDTLAESHVNEILSKII